MRAPCRQRPLRNGSSDTTLEVLLALTLLGASVLTAMAVLRPSAPRDDGGERQPNEDAEHGVDDD